MFDGEEDFELISYLTENNSFENAMDRHTAGLITSESQLVSLEANGGYPLDGEVSFSVNGVEYAVIAYGASGENEGEDALAGMIFVRESAKSLPDSQPEDRGE